jgi:hypothetical protein
VKFIYGDRVRTKKNGKIYDFIGTTVGSVVDYKEKHYDSWNGKGQEIIFYDEYGVKFDNTEIIKYYKEKDLEKI